MWFRNLLELNHTRTIAGLHLFMDETWTIQKTDNKTPAANEIKFYFEEPKALQKG